MDCAHRVTVLTNRSYLAHIENDHISYVGILKLPINVSQIYRESMEWPC